MIYFIFNIIIGAIIMTMIVCSGLIKDEIKRDKVQRKLATPIAICTALMIINVIIFLI